MGEKTTVCRPQLAQQKWPVISYYGSPHRVPPLGCPARTYIDQLLDDMGCLPEELPAAMQIEMVGGEGSWESEIARLDDDDNRNCLY